MPPLLVPATLPLPAVLDRLRAGHRQLACVVDEYGGFAGIITLEDIAEELVGADPRRGRPAGAGAGPAGRRLLGGAGPLADRRGRRQPPASTLPEATEYDTLSGLVMPELGRVPRGRRRLVIELPPGRRRRAAGAGGPVDVLAVDRHVAARSGSGSPMEQVPMSTDLGAAHLGAAAGLNGVLRRRRVRPGREQALPAGAGRRRAAAGPPGPRWTAVRELSLMLAGAQLGITLCTLGLGALAEPAIEHLLSPLLHAVGPARRGRAT